MIDQNYLLLLSPLVETIVKDMDDYLCQHKNIELPGWVLAGTSILIGAMISFGYSLFNGSNFNDAWKYAIAIGGSASVINIAKKFADRKPIINNVKLDN